MQTVSRMSFTTVKTEGAILPADLLQGIADGRDLEGLAPTDYHLAPNERLNEAVNRAWNRCLGVWQSFNEQRGRLPASDAGTTLTRERWLLILFQELGYGRLPYQGSLPIGPDGDAPRYPISHAWEGAPIHLVTFRQGLDCRDPSGGRSPHSLLQEFLNRSDDHLWGFLSNGLRLRVLRDNVSLTRAAYVEFDLQAMMDGELYADFSLLWLVCHQSRVEGKPPSECWLERWSQEAAAQGTRALDALRDGVQEAIVALGRGFLGHRANAGLKARLRSGELSAQDYYRQLLRLVYRLIFLFVAEDRDLLLLRQADERPQTTDDDQPSAVVGQPSSVVRRRSRYYSYYSVTRLRHLAEVQRGGPHPDLYRCLRQVFVLLREGYEPLGLPGLGGFLFSERSTPALDGADLANRDLLDAVRALAFTVEGRVRRPVDYKNLGSEELGSVYESLLELHPQLNADAGTFALDVAAGSERKTTGSYYTPSSLIRSLLDSALEPVVEDRLRQATVGGPSSAVTPQEEAILSIKVVDPACGSGHFLIAAAHRLARHLARVRTGDEEPAPAELRAALRDVVRRCIHGVDINPMAVELCKVALWMETLDPGKPLSFLERNVQCGNSLIGATPALLQRGIPDNAFKPITGDDKAYCREWRKRNKQQRESQQMSLFAPDLQPWDRLGNLAASMMTLDAVGEDTVGDVQRKQEMYESLVRSSDYRYGRLWADAWCAAFVWKKTKEFAYPITEEVFRRVERNPFDVAPWMVEEIERLREQYGFFHWHLAFPHVFGPQTANGRRQESDLSSSVVGQRSASGFDVVLGNPPWERIRPEADKFFATTYPEFGKLKRTERNKEIEKLAVTSPAIYIAWQEERRSALATTQFLKVSNRFPLSTTKNVNTYAVFQELALQVLHHSGRSGLILQSGIATDHINRALFDHIMSSEQLVSLYDFENRLGIFPAVHRMMKFCLLTVQGSTYTQKPRFMCYATSVGDTQDTSRVFHLSRKDLDTLAPNTGLLPMFRSRQDAELILKIYAVSGSFIVDNQEKGNPWNATIRRFFSIYYDSTDLQRSGSLDFIPKPQKPESAATVRLYEAKLFHQFDHRFATYQLSGSDLPSTL